ncbi:hypothetical protein TCDM_12364 [Trypanosoma cruzi Dm28c]|uniref:Leishmanolysin-like peptidase n=1 Tax=Trypanosoma cruzi Dm28c TaxID=1416333 RepID=V5AUC1_TRYCR|nr:hypothetical protein TCDM_12364 [Trypanosoma cruzi Dm28c]
MIFLMCCTDKRFAASLTCSCSSDKAMRTASARSIPAVVRDVPFGAEGASQTCSVIGRNGWAPIRIDVSTRDLDGTRKYCSWERYYEMNSSNENCDCKDDFFRTEEKGIFPFCHTLRPLFFNILRTVRRYVASFSSLNAAVVRHGFYPKSQMLSCRGRGHSHSVCGRASRGLSRLSGWWVAAEEWLKGYGCHWSLRRCVVRFLLVDTLDIFGNALRVRHLLGRPWCCRRIHMRGLLQRLECQG